MHGRLHRGQRRLDPLADEQRPGRGCEPHRATSYRPEQCPVATTADAGRVAVEPCPMHTHQLAIGAIDGVTIAGA
jgi:hypothetical protein